MFCFAHWFISIDKTLKKKLTLVLPLALNRGFDRDRGMPKGGEGVVR